MATPLAGEATKHVISHCLKCFATVGIPSIIKTDDGTAYINMLFSVSVHK